MYIIDQSSDHCSIYDIHDAQIRKSFRYDGLATVLREFSTHARVAQEKSIVCLLSEELFSLHRFVIHMSCDEPFSIQQLKACIQQKCGEIADAEEIRTPYVVHHVMDIVVNGVAGQHVLWMTGDLRFTLLVCALNPAGIALCSLLGSDTIFQDSHISFYPRNYFTMQYLTNHLRKDDFSLLFIDQESCKVIRIANGRYDQVRTINIGMQLLKSCYQEHDVEKYFYTSRADVQDHPFLSKVIDEAVSFFTDMLSKWVASGTDTSKSLIVAGDIIANPSFLPLFQDSFRAYGSGFILPLQPLEHDAYDHVFAAHEISVASYLHMQKIA